MRWTRERIEAFKRAWASKQTVAAIAAAFGFANQSVATNQARRLGLTPRAVHKSWTADDDRELTRLWPLRCAALSNKHVARHLGTTPCAVRHAADRLGLPKLRGGAWRTSP